MFTILYSSSFWTLAWASNAMTLLDMQILFGRLYGTLLVHITTSGFDYTLDWVYRPPEVAAYYASLGIGIRHSEHTIKLAGDINLFKNGIWLRNTEDHRPFGEWWEHQNPLCMWGGRFGDGNHYSLIWRGVK
jgi:hypothetical protein